MKFMTDERIMSSCIMHAPTMTSLIGGVHNLIYEVWWKLIMHMYVRVGLSNI